MTSLIDRLSELDEPDRTTAATIQKIRDAFAVVKPCIAVLRAKEASTALQEGTVMSRKPMNESDSKLVRDIFDIAIERKLTDQQFATLAKDSYRNIVNWRTGTNVPNTKAVEGLAKALGKKIVLEDV